MILISIPSNPNITMTISVDRKDSNGIAVNFFGILEKFQLSIKIEETGRFVFSERFDEKINFHKSIDLSEGPRAVSQTHFGRRIEKNRQDIFLQAILPGAVHCTLYTC